MRVVIVFVISAVVAAYPVQKLVADQLNAPSGVVWLVWIGLTAALAFTAWLLLRHRNRR